MALSFKTTAETVKWCSGSSSFHVILIFFVFNTSIVTDQPKTLQEVAKSCADKDGPQSPSSSPDKHHLSLAEAAKVYEDAAGPSQSKFEQVEKVTGEEEERNVLQVNTMTLLHVVLKTRLSKQNCRMQNAFLGGGGGLFVKQLLYFTMFKTIFNKYF